MRVERKPVVTTETVITLIDTEARYLKEVLNTYSFDYGVLKYNDFMRELIRELNAK